MASTRPVQRPHAASTAPAQWSAHGQHLEEGRRQLALGQLLDARAAFVEASLVDAEDMDTRSFLGEVDLTLELSRQLAHRRDEGGDTPRDGTWTELESQLSPEQHRTLEVQLEHERELRDELLLTLEAMGAGDLPFCGGRTDTADGEQAEGLAPWDSSTASINALLKYVSASLALRAVSAHCPINSSING